MSRFYKSNLTGRVVETETTPGSDLGQWTEVADRDGTPIRYFQSTAIPEFVYDTVGRFYCNGVYDPDGIGEPKEALYEYCNGPVKYYKEVANPVADPLHAPEQDCTLDVPIEPPVTAIQCLDLYMSGFQDGMDQIARAFESGSLKTSAHRNLESKQAELSQDFHEMAQTAHEVCVSVRQLTVENDKELLQAKIDLCDMHDTMLHSLRCFRAFAKSKNYKSAAAIFYALIGENPGHFPYIDDLHELAEDARNFRLKTQKAEVNDNVAST